MRNLLWWCIWLQVVGSLSVVAGGWWSVAGTNTFGNTSRSTQAQEATPANHQPPATNHYLPCTDSSPTCLQMLGDIAVQNSREIAVLAQAIKLQKKKLWISWLNADGLHPVAIGLRLARNIAGGGDRAAAKLELARLELRQAELATQRRESIVRAVLDYETAQRQWTSAETKLATHQARLHLLAIAYRLGEGSTETMLPLWQTETELQGEVERTKIDCRQRLTQLQAIVVPFAREGLHTTVKNPKQK